jgi:quinol-cytochrome oxidoreductase complex cytochrome b subunit
MKMSNIKNHPNFGKKFTFFAFVIFIFDAIIFGLCFYLHSEGLEKTSDILLILIFVITFIFFTFGFIFLYNVKCPSCGQKTKTIKNRKIDMWQAYCSKCDVTWNLGLGIDTGP